MNTYTIRYMSKNGFVSDIAIEAENWVAALETFSKCAEECGIEIASAGIVRD